MPTLVGAGTLAWSITTAATISPGLPAGWAAGDIHVLVTLTVSGVAVTALSGWTQLAALSGVVTGGVRVEVWWRRAVAGDTDPAVDIPAGINVRGARVYGVRGCATSGSPFDTGTGAPTRSNNTALDFTIEFTDLTTTVANCLVLAVGAFDDDFAAATTMAGWTLPADGIVSTTAGTDLGFVHQYRTLTAAGAAGPATVTVSGGSVAASASAGLVLAFPPSAAAGTVAQRWTGSAWTPATVQRWSGSAWVPATVKRWDGTGWV